VSLNLKYYSVFDFLHWRTLPPKISKKQAEEIALKAMSEKWTVRKLMLWERIRNGGKEIRSVWTVTMSYNIPEGESLEDVVIDADTGEIIEGNSF
jgi:Zn-dependent metalloprotease